MGRPKKKIQKRQKIFNFISWAIDLVKIKWKKYIQISLSVLGFAFFIYVVFFWLDTVDKIVFEIIYY
jgi:preprotein translocase subunit SecE